MKIVMLTTNMALGGAETQVAHLAIEMKRRGHQIDIVSLLPATAFADRIMSAGVGLHTPGPLLAGFTLARLRPEILHCHMFHANVLGRLLRTLLPFPGVISTLHSTAESRKGSKQVIWRDLAYRLTDPLADAVAGVSEAVLERHTGNRAIRRTALVIPNGIDTSVFRPDEGARERMRRELGIADDHFVWIAVGRLMWKKNFAALLSSFPDSDRATLLLVGDGPDREELSTAARPNVRLLGQRSDIPALLNAADAFVLSSVVEGLPLALLEAAACGLPCLATDVGGVRETGVAVVLRDATELSNGIREIMLMSEAKRRELGDVGRRTVASRYSLEAVATQWERLYSSILKAST
ncbi:MAG: glycosyltransferase [Bryobacteraceae bacterium]|nr:glycosyltransferase [Bryobacteraceae bacterium]